VKSPSAVVSIVDRCDPTFDVLPVDSAPAPSRRHRDAGLRASAGRFVRRGLRSGTGAAPRAKSAAVRRRRQCVKRLPAGVEKPRVTGCAATASSPGRTNARSRHERVVVSALIMWLVRFADNARRTRQRPRSGGGDSGRRQPCMCRREVVPARGEGWPFSKRRRRQERANLLCGRKAEPRRSNFLDDGEYLRSSSAQALERHETRDSVRHAMIPLRFTAF